MANALFDQGREDFLAGTLDWDADEFRIALVDDTDVTFDLAVNDFWDDLVAGLVHANGESDALGSKSTTAGVADAADKTWSTVSGDAADYVVCFKETGTDATQNLVFALDSATTGIPVTPNGGNITITFDSGANKIFKL